MRNLLDRAGMLFCRLTQPLNECKFLIVCTLSFPFIYQWIYCSIQTFKPINYLMMSNFKAPGSRVPLKTLGVLDWGFHLRGLGSQVPFFQHVLLRCSYKEVFWKYALNLQEPPMWKFDFNKVAKQLNLNLTSVLVFSCNFAVYFQKTFL